MDKMAVFNLLLVFSLLWGFSSSKVIKYHSNELCSKQIQMSKTDEVLFVEFQVPDSAFAEGKCTGYINWVGDTRFTLIALLSPHQASTINFLRNSPIPKSYIDYTDYNNTMYKLEIDGPKPYSIRFVPTALLNLKSQNICPQDHLPCSVYGCVHSQLICDSAIECYNFNKSSLCSYAPTNAFLLSCLFGIFMSFIVVSFCLGLHIYCKFYRKSDFLLKDRIKPRFYGAVNGSFASDSSMLSLNSSSNKKNRFYENIQHYNEYINNNLK